MDFKVNELRPHDVYKMLAAIVVPRPIAFVTTVSPAGVVNAAPFSFFNLLGSDPPIVGIGIAPRSTGDLKDTLSNIQTAREFVVHLVDEKLTAQMNICATDFPPDVSELSQAELDCHPAVFVAPPVISAALVHLECVLEQIVHVGNNNIVLGRIIAFGIDDRFINPSTLRVDTFGLRLVGRMHGGGWYAKTSDLFEIDRIPIEQWDELHK